MNPSTIIVIDYNIADVELLDLALKDAISDIIRLIAYTSSVSAVQELSTLRPLGAPIMAVLLDFSVLRDAGFDLIERLRCIPQIACVPVVLWSSVPPVSGTDRMLKRRLTFLTKPVDWPEFREFPAQLMVAIRENGALSSHG